MRIGFLVNSILKGNADSTTYSLAGRLAALGHQVWVSTSSGFSFEPDGQVRIFARRAADGRTRSPKRYLEALRSADARTEWVDVDSLDGLLLRFNPFALKPWALAGSLALARRATANGALVLNDAEGLSRATGKLYLQDFPEEVRPRTLITRHRARIERFLEDEGRIVLKPMSGYGGRNVFLISREDRVNLDQILGVVAQEGFVVAQEYLPAAAEGDTRLFLLDGEPIVVKGKHAVVQRVSSGDDLRSNVHAGGEPRPAKMTDALYRIAELVRPRLRADGMFLVGVDVAGDRILEINVFSPGGLHVLRELEGVDFIPKVARAVERRIAEHGNRA